MTEISSELQAIINALPDATDGYNAKMFYERLLSENARLRDLLTALASDEAALERYAFPLHIGYGRAGVFDSGPGAQCVYCDESSGMAATVVHAADCPILLAQQALAIEPQS